jgi:hypothetical protein
VRRTLRGTATRCWETEGSAALFDYVWGRRSGGEAPPVLHSTPSCASLTQLPPLKRWMIVTRAAVEPVPGRLHDTSYRNVEVSAPSVG